MVIVLVARDHLAIIFSSSKEMQEAVADLAHLLGITMVLNSVQPVISGIALIRIMDLVYHCRNKDNNIVPFFLLAGVAVGGGWQALVAYINLGCYYIFGLPLGYLLGYVAKLGTKVTSISNKKL